MLLVQSAVHLGSGWRIQTIGSFHRTTISPFLLWFISPADKRSTKYCCFSVYSRNKLLCYPFVSFSLSTALSAIYVPFLSRISHRTLNLHYAKTVFLFPNVFSFCLTYTAPHSYEMVNSILFTTSVT